MANAEHLLVPIKVQALVIDDIVIQKMGALMIEGQKYAANDGRWSPLAQDYRLLVNSLSAPGPNPFYGASRTYQGHPADQLVLDAGSSALPEPKDRGIYLHWVLPSGLRHAYTPGSLDFPALPDQWLIVRFCRRDAALQTKAWFVDSGLVDNTTGPANLLFSSREKYVGRRVGKVVPLDSFAPADFHGERTTITALGNAQTGSPTFTASVAENRNILSWHDDLSDLREQTGESKVPKGTAISYLLLGWYHDEQNEPLAALSARLIDKHDAQNRLSGWLIEPPGWLIDAASPLPADLLKRRCLFHGMVAHINYWSSETYKGPMLGYPGSPSVEGVLGEASPTFKVGVGNDVEDALVSLVSSEYSGEQEGSNLAKEAPNLWKALEAVIYRQPESLVGSWNAAPRDHAVHQNWFSTLEAGKIWFIRPCPDKEGVFPADPDKTAAQTAVQPTPEHLAALKQLNETQSAADAVSREVAALQQDLYARWWKLCQKSRASFRANLTAEENDCRLLAGHVLPLRTRRDELLNRLRTLPEELKQKLPKELELRYDAAPRFWTPADPVIIVKNCGLPTKHQFPRPLPCRLPEQIVTAAEVMVDKQNPKPFSTAAGVTEIAAAVQKHFAPRSEILTRLLNEASLVEQAIRDLVDRTLPTEKEFSTAGLWQKWTERLVEDLTWDRQSDWYPNDQIRFGKPGALDIQPHRLAELWGQQPWSPLFLDWQITWFPTPNISAAEQGFGPVWPLGDYDYVPLDRKSLPKKGFTVRGRSLLSPIDGRIFKEPIETLRGLLQTKRDGTQKKDGNPAFPEAVAEILSRYEVVWDKTLGELANAGLMGQALTGFHQALLHRNITLPRVTPDPTHPWVGSEKLKSLENEIRALLDSPDAAVLTGERLAPPPPATPDLPFSMIRAGALRIDELWLVDDFGQWADLLGLTSARSKSSGQVFHPRMRWHDDQSVMAMPPRVVQPVRLNFRFTAADKGVVESSSDPALSPICGWMFYNPLDQALVLCDQAGRLVGELVITKEQGGFRINWEAGAGGVALDEVRNPDLKAFAQGLIETTLTLKPRLHDLLNLIDRALERIRPAAARRDTALFGRPLALVSAHLGFELFGKAWTDPHKPATTPLEGTGDAALNALRVRVHLGCLHNTEDGLIGYFKAGGYNHIVPTQLSQKIEASGYIAHPENDAVRVGFGAPERLTLLMDPWGSVQAACGLVPAKTITLAQSELDKTVAQMEASFRVGPVLLQANRLALPTPVGDKGRWNFSGPLTNHAAAAVIASDPKYFSDQPMIATEGRLLLLNTEE